MFILKQRWLLVLAIALSLFISTTQVCLAEDSLSIIDVQKYDRSIQIMAMLLLGFGFLMVFLRRYGRSALTATFLLVSSSIPLYLLFDNLGLFGSATNIEIDSLILGEFAAAAF